MSTAIEISLTPQAEAILRRVAAWPKNVLVTIARTIDEQNNLTVDHIRKKYLSFPKHSPSTPEGLRVQSNRYRQSLRPSKAVITGSGITSSIGSNVTNKGVSYPRLHEYGGVVHHPARAGSVRLRTNAGGELIRQPGRRGAVFAAKHHKRTKQIEYQGKAYDVTYPARAPIRRGIADRLPEYRSALSENLVRFYEGKV